jgi:hypothetical protein
MAVTAQDEGVFNLGLDARADYVQEFLPGNSSQDGSGFKGKYLNIRINGNITGNLSYAFQHRLNKPITRSDLFEATDWVTLTYNTGNWIFSGGKQVVAIGGYEYDAAPINLYFCSEFWNNIPCYQFGLSAAYSLSEGDDILMFQFCESPFRRNAANHSGEGMFAYNLMWTGSHEWFRSLYSLNMIEYLPGKYINYIALGNRFTFGDFLIDLDLMSRAVSLSDLAGKNFSIMSEFKWSPSESFNIFARFTHDRNLSDKAGDWCVAQGTDITRAGAGIEYFPIKGSNKLRLHLNCCHDFGKAAATGILRPGQTTIDAGMTWRMNLLNIKR